MTLVARPNLLLITTDQQRYDTIRPHAPSFLRTPHLDFLQAEGVTFERAYAETPICVPARVSLLTGQSPFRHGATCNRPTSDVVRREETLPWLLGQAGYATAAIGKMHFSPQRARHGFDETRLPADYYRWIRESGSVLQPMRHGIGQNELFPAVSTVPEGLTLTSWIAEQCVHFIREGRDPTCPFFLWASFSKPHPPLDPPEPYASMYRDWDPPAPIRSAWSESPAAPAAFVRQRERGGFDRMPDGMIDDARRAYLGLVTHVDYALGRILSALQDMDLLNDTTIIFTSDHGEFLGDHRCGNKVMWHEPSARLPLVVRPAPSLGIDVAGTSSDALVTQTDVPATFLEHAGADASHADGMALCTAEGVTAGRDWLFGLATERPRPSQTTAQAAERLLYLAVTDGRWKYLWYPEGPAEQLFDLASDPHEEIDVAGSAEASDVKDRLAEALLKHAMATVPSWVPGPGLPTVAALNDSTLRRRASSWPGFHTDQHDADVRH
jgi:arylsulfatase